MSHSPTYGDHDIKHTVCRQLFFKKNDLEAFELRFPASPRPPLETQYVAVQYNLFEVQLPRSLNVGIDFLLISGVIP
nr:hypothetical protein 495p1_00148 [Serratia proteamaculans]